MPGPSNFSPGKDWMIGNVQQFGFYRVNYENDNWLALIKQLQTDHKVSMIHAVADLSNLTMYSILPFFVNTAKFVQNVLRIFAGTATNVVIMLSHVYKKRNIIARKVESINTIHECGRLCA